MLLSSTLPPRKRPRFSRFKAVHAFVCCGCFWAAGATAASAGPVIINYPFTANPGDVISLEGSGFGAAPKVYLKPSLQAAAVALPTKTANDGTVVVEVPKTTAFDLYNVWISNGSATSPQVALNAPQAMHFDNAEVVSGVHFRIFGRNLYVNAKAPAVTLVDTQTNAQLNATVATATSSPFYLDVVAPSGVVAGHAYSANVSNGYAMAPSSATILGHAAGTDHFAIGQPWAYDFIYADGPTYQAGVKGTNQADHHVFNVKTDPSLTIHAVGDGKTNDAAAIRAAITLASVHGGVVYLPAGTYNTGATGLQMASNVVLQGAGVASTKMLFGPTGGGIYIPGGSQMVGFVDMSIQNVDLTSNYIVNLTTGNQSVSKIFLQRLNCSLGSGKGILLQGDRIAILNSTFTQAINYQNGNAALQTGGMGPIYVGATPTSNLQIKNNAIKWATGQNSLANLNNAIIENNVFTRSASDTITVGPAQLSWSNNGYPLHIGDKIQRVMGRQLAINFGKDVVVQNNTFNVSDGVLKYNWNDGETIQNEAGALHVQEDTGTITAASASSVTDNSKCVGSCAWIYTPNSSMVVIVSGAGAGQWRHITAQSGNTFTVDKPFDVVPAVGDHFAVSVPAFENAIIRGNSMTGNPMGVSLYHGAFLNVSVSNNTLTNNGGIYLIPAQQNVVETPSTTTNLPFNVSRNIEIVGNTLTNSAGWYPSFISLVFALEKQTTFWGKSMIGAQVRNNKITARVGTIHFPFAEGIQ
ncbi:MAG: glycosyl hydrolase family 28-related protein, partial [Methylocella sp.]